MTNEKVLRREEWRYDNAHEYESNLICPYCDCEFDDYESWEITKYDCGDIECPNCGKFFHVEIRQITEFSTYKRYEDMPADWGKEDDE